MLSKERILRLAAKYSPLVRFYPEGSEGSQADDEAAKKAKADQQRKIDLERQNEQQLEQERSNARRAREELSETQSQLESTHSENEALKAKLAAAEAKAAEAGIHDIDLDESEYQGTDLALVKAIKNLNAKIDAKDKKIEGLEKKASDYEKQSREEQAKLARNSAFEELLSDLDNEYGADCRNDAVQKFNEKCDKGEVPKGNPAKATRIMESCYKEVKAARSKEKKDKSLPLDSGSGGGNAPNLSPFEIKAGQSLDEAVAQIAAASKMK